MSDDVNASEAARALGRRARGVPKQYSQAEIERRTKRLVEARRESLQTATKGTKKGKPK